jgi:pyruvate/2-oxoglutarate dehydrogenase complex dihydrolipoamide acyltransferase (E2) component
MKIMLPALAGERGRVAWRARQGDAVKAGDVVLEIDLGFMKVPVAAPTDGKVGKTVVEDGAETSGSTTAAAFEPAPEPPGKDAWARIECTFKCRACAFVVPLDEVDLDGAVVCARCGLEQAFEQRLWHSVFDFAHGIADRALDHDRLAIGDETHLTVVAKGGTPSCATCNGTLAITTNADRTTAACPRCGTSIEYVVPAAAIRMTKAALRGVVADAHRASAAVKVEQTASAIAIQCPSCSASLDVPDDAKVVVVCKFCKATSRIPQRILFKLKGGDTTPAPIWLEFHGPSRARKDGARQKEQAEHDARIASIQAAARAHRESTARDHKKRDEDRRREEKAAREAAEASEEKQRNAEREARETRRDAEERKNYAIVFGLIAVVLTIAIIAYLASR